MFRLFRPTYTVNGESRQSRVFWAEFTLRDGVKIRESLKTRSWDVAWRVAQAREEALLLEQAQIAQKSPQTRRQPQAWTRTSPEPSDAIQAILTQLQPHLPEHILVQALAQAITTLLTSGMKPQTVNIPSACLYTYTRDVSESNSSASRPAGVQTVTIPAAGGPTNTRSVRDANSSQPQPSPGAGGACAGRLARSGSLAGAPGSGGAGGEARTLRQACNDFLRTLRATRGKATFMTARSALKRVLEILGRDRPAESITQADVIRLIERLKAEGLSSRTINLAVSHLARALGGTVRSLWPAIRKLRENSDAGRALSDDEIRRLLDEADRLAAGEDKLTLSDSRRGAWIQSIGPRGVLLPCFLRLLLYTGMRSGEAKKLQWRHVDFQKGLISVPGTKTDAARRVIPMHPDLVRVLQTHQEWYVARFGRTEADWFVFPAGSPAPNNPRKPVSDFKHGWETIRERAGVQCRMHDLRHTFISRLAESGVPEVTLMELAGHVSRAMMLRYSHPRIEARREAVKAIRLG